MSTNQEEPQEPIGGAGGIPDPSTKQKFGKLPGLNIRQTYKVIIAIPTVQLAVSFVLFFITWFDWYDITYGYFSQISGFSLMMGLYMWYMAKLSGSCTAALLSIYTLILLNILNIIHLFTPLGYYTAYGLVITGVGLLFSIAFFIPAIAKRRKKG